MAKKSDGKGKKKGGQLVIRIDRAEREAFVTLCEQMDTSAAREIRRFMRGFVAAHATAPAASDAEGPADQAPPPEEAASEAATPQRPRRTRAQATVDGSAPAPKAEEAAPKPAGPPRPRRTRARAKPAD